MLIVIKVIVLHHANTKPCLGDKNKVLSGNIAKTKVKLMVTIETEILIHAPAQRIFKDLSIQHNLPRIWPSVIKIKNEQLLPNGGYSAEWVYKMAGMHFAGTGEYVDVALNRYFTIKTKGAVVSTISMTFRPTDGKTRVTLTIDYQVPSALLAWLSGNVIVKMNEHEADLILANLQVMMEESPTMENGASNQRDRHSSVIYTPPRVTYTLIETSTIPAVKTTVI